MASTHITELERENLKALFVGYYEEVPVIKYAAYYVGITEQTAHDWLDKDEVFLSRINQAKARWAKKRALKTRAEFQLERLDKEIWREQKDLTSNGETLKGATIVFADKPDTDPEVS